MVDFRAELAALVAAYDEHESRWPQADVDALYQAVEHARDVLAQPEPASAADGEVAELAAWLTKEMPPGTYIGDPTWWASRIAGRAHILMKRQALRPIPVSERLPEPSVKVLAHYCNCLGKGRTICAIWVPAKTRSDSYGDDDFTEYDEASDTFYWPEGWYEAIENWDDLGYVKVDEGEVIYWQPLPEWPAHAPPLPEVNDD